MNTLAGRCHILTAIVTITMTLGSPLGAQEATQESTATKGIQRAPIVVSDAAAKLHAEAIVVDGHNDLPWNIRERGASSFDKVDIAHPQEEMHTDIPRLRQGGLDVQFWSVWVPADTMFDGDSLSTTLEQIAIVRDMIQHYPDTFAFAGSVVEIEKAVADGKIASLIGVEGGHSIENSLSVLRQLYQQGARYMTLTHSLSLDWADSATDKQPLGGLNAFGEEVVREMNKIGMLVDISHVSADCMKDALRVSKAPVIFSHSSAKAIADHPRNVPDDVLQLTAENGGVVMVNFFSGYSVPEATKVMKRITEMQLEMKQAGKEDEEIRKEVRAFVAANPLVEGSIHDLLDHIDHIVEVAGIDHVGLGSDYDGVSKLPKQLQDVSTYPNITQGLLDRGYSAADVKKVLGGNLMRVFAEAERVAKELSGT